MFLFYATLVVAALLTYFLWGLGANDKNAPPGPRPWPILGNLVHLARASDDLTLTFAELGKVYGEIFSIKMGLKSTVILTSREAIETVTSHEAMYGRDRSGMLSDRSEGRNLGVVMSDGEMWEKSRVWCFRNLKEFGFGKSSEMEHYIHGAAAELYSKVDASQQSKGFVEMELLFSYSIFAIMWQMMVGSLTPEGKADVRKISEKSEAFVRSSTFGSGLANAYPFLRFVFPGLTGYRVQMAFFDFCSQIAEKIYHETQANLGSGPPSCFAEAFLANADKDKEIFNGPNFRIIFQDLMIASSETTNSFLEVVVVLLILHPEKQEKIFEEIRAVSESGSEISYADRKKMVYTQAFLLECHRFARVLQNYVPRKALKDFKYKEYTIKKDTVTFVDTYLYYNDPKVWEDPTEFRPERFISDKAQIQRGSDIISFGFGRRNCPGEQYAGVLSFVWLTSLVQRYRISNPAGEEKPRLNLRPGLSFRPFLYKACFTLRN